MASNTQFFGHPRGLSTLFFTELWERFSFYGMKAMLFLFITANIVEGPQSGLGIGAEVGGAIAGLYNSFVYLLALPGGWLADRLIGQRKAVLVGAIIIACGHYSMAVPGVFHVGELFFFYLGLVLIVIGTGLLKPNISTMVGELYEGDKGARRDAGFSIFYMGINLGAWLAPLACGWVRQSFGWHFAFGLAGIGMTFGVVWYIMDGKNLGSAGIEPKSPIEDRPRAKRQAFTALFVLLGAAALLTVGQVTGVIGLTWTAAADFCGSATLILVALFMAFVAVEVAPAEHKAGMRTWVGALFGGALVVSGAAATFMIQPFEISQVMLWMTYAIWAAMLIMTVYLALASGEGWGASKKVAVIGILFVFTAMFWSGFEQASTSLNVFARDFTDRAMFGWEVPTEFLQSINPLFIIILAPFFGALWVKLAAKNLNPSIPLKFALGLLQLSLGFFVIMFAAGLATEIPGVEGDAAKGASVAWLTMMYLLFTTGELCLSPIGLSTITKLAPSAFVSQMMGIWFIAAALGNLIAGRVGGQIEHLPHEDIFRIVAMIIGGAGLVLLLFGPVIRRRMMPDVD